MTKFKSIAKNVTYFLTLSLFAHLANAAPKSVVLADKEKLKAIDAEILQSHAELNVAVALVSETQKDQLSHLAHEHGACGGYEFLAYENNPLNWTQDQNPLNQLLAQKKINESYANKFSVLSAYPTPAMVVNENIQKAVDAVDQGLVGETIRWLSVDYPSRYNRLSDPNKHVVDLKNRVEAMAQEAGRSAVVEMVDHNSTRQKSLRVRLLGSDRPSEVVVLGGHLDSITSFNRGDAPGADDNASGSAAVLEAYRLVLLQKPNPRTIEFIWYAGEESGLLGSAEIAADYKNKGVDVVGVMQLDMTGFPGSGELMFANIGDFTSVWLQDYLKTINSMYVKATVIETACGYGCSDHASWYRQGFPAVFPFEAEFNDYNSNIHTSRDKIELLSFPHVAMFAKLALAFVLDLSNSNLRHP